MIRKVEPWSKFGIWALRLNQAYYKNQAYCNNQADHNKLVSREKLEMAQIQQEGQLAPFLSTIETALSGDFQFNEMEDLEIKQRFMLQKSLLSVAHVLEAESDTGDSCESLHKLAVVCRLYDYPQLAQRLYLRALERSIGDSGEQSIATARHRNFLAGLYVHLSRFEEASRLINQSLGAYEKHLGIEHLYCRMTLFASVLVYAKQNKMMEALKLFEMVQVPSHSMSGNAFSDSQWSVVSMRLWMLSLLRFTQGRYDDAYELFRYTAILEANEVWPGNLLIYKALSDLIALCRTLGLQSESQECQDLSALIESTLANTRRK